MKVKRNDWYKALSREFSFFMTYEITKGYDNMFKRYGYTLFNVLFHSKNGILTMIRKKSEMKELIDYIESLPEQYIVGQLKKADELNDKLNKKLKGLRLNLNTWNRILALCEELWACNMFCIYFGYAAERKKIKKIKEKKYELVIRVRNGINDLQVLDDFLKNYFTNRDLSEFTANEIKEFLRNKKVPSKKELEERKKEFLLVMENLKVKRIPKKNIQKTISKYIKEEKSKLKELKGNIAFKRNVSGPARIVLKRKDLNSIKKGEILVTMMTSPEYVPYLSKIKGIITDNGGATCHASIIAREMKIPCIVGTHNATKIFKDGDLIEINGDKRIVRKI